MQSVFLLCSLYIISNDYIACNENMIFKKLMFCEVIIVMKVTRVGEDVENLDTSCNASAAIMEKFVHSTLQELTIERLPPPRNTPKRIEGRGWLKASAHGNIVHRAKVQTAQMSTRRRWMNTMRSVRTAGNSP